LMALCLELGVKPAPPISRHSVLNALRDCLLQHGNEGRNVVVCIDEAQAIPLRTVESLRLLSNLETEKRKLLQLVLLGQPELDVKLARPEIRQLMQRITFSEYLGPMPADLVPVYLAHRLTTAAASMHTDVQVFEPEAAKAIARYSGGVPRLINVLSHKCLMLAYGENVHRVGRAHVELAAKDTPGVVPRQPWWRRLWPRKAAPAPVLLSDSVIGTPARSKP